jgi:thiamine pyrophosphokinase
MTSTVLIVTNGANSIPDALMREHWSAVIAVDGGLGALRRAGLTPTHVLGDFDSAAPDAVEAARRAGAEVHSHPADKDATDLELGLELAMSLGMSVGMSVGMSLGMTSEAAREGGNPGPAITVVSGPGDRFDHLLAEAALLAAPAWRQATISAAYEPASVSVVWFSRAVGATPREFACDPGELISVLAVNGPATLSISGVRWALDHATLNVGSTRGVSNESTGTVTITVHHGCVLVIRPFAFALAVRQLSDPSNKDRS